MFAPAEVIEHLLKPSELHAAGVLFHELKGLDGRRDWI